jgi:hypothetical protein
MVLDAVEKITGRYKLIGESQKQDIPTIAAGLAR